MARRPVSPFEFIDIHGRPWQGAGTPAKAKGAVAVDKRVEAATARLSPADIEQVFDALVIADWRRSKTTLMQFMRAIELRRVGGQAFNGEEVGAALRQLAQHGRAHEFSGEGWSAPAELAAERRKTLFKRPEVAQWWRGWLWAAGGAYGAMDSTSALYFAPQHQSEVTAFLRLLLCSGIDAKAYRKHASGAMRFVSGPTLRTALEQMQHEGLAERLEPGLRWQLLEELQREGEATLAPALMAWADAHIDQAKVDALETLHPLNPQTAPRGVPGLRLAVAERRLQLGHVEGMARAIGADAAALAFLPLLQALGLAREGRFADAAAAFPPAWKDLCARLGKRRGFAPQRLLQWYPLALLARGEVASWTLARRFCVAMSGSRQPMPHDDWGRLVHVLEVRLGDARLDLSAFAAPRPSAMLKEAWPGQQQDPDGLADRLLLAAWLGKAPAGWTPAILGGLTEALFAAGLPWKAELLKQACLRLGWAVPARRATTPAAPIPWAAHFFAPAQDAWREALAAITALGEARGAAGTAAAAVPVTLRWRLALDEAGRVYNLGAFEPSASGRGKPKLLSTTQLKKRTRLDPRDAAVARCLREPRYGYGGLTFDLVQAAVALVGHPALELADAPGVDVELVESLPVLEVRRERGQDAKLLAGADVGASASAGADASASAGAGAGASAGAGSSASTGAPAEHFVFRLQDELLTDDDPELDHHEPFGEEAADEVERRNSLRIVREAPTRARLMRINAAQRRVAELISQRWAVPTDATAELDAALRVLAGHFVLHSDAAAGEPVASDARLVAQLQPRGDALRVALLVRPFGEFGPMLPPGQGRARLMTLHGGISLATERALEAERAHLATALEALPFLGSHGELPPDGMWQLDEPEQALAAVHELGRLAGEGQALRALEWPKGQPLRVHAPEARAFAGALRSGRDWFALDGELKLDEQRVLSLQQLLGLLRESRGSRYVALGNGEYLALADQLRQRLAELEAIGEADGTAMKLGATAAAWLAEAAPALGVQGDAGWQRRAAQLEAAAALAPEVPHGLQATLRPYQTEGYVWLRRLAEAGFGAILADDMGLGKTIQTLALLLARAASGPALVVAPTSVCSNWAEEVARFAPALGCSVYGQGEGERSAQIEGAAASDVLVVSYALLLRDAEAFAEREWGTLVLDEAQALKNAATQRVQAVAGLRAGFKLALSGTPVENRLADLWSIMNLLNPGLLGSASRFGERFANPIERQRNEAARARLRRLVGPFLLRRTKAQVLTDLPPRTEIIERIEPSADERAFLEAMRRDAVARIAQLDPADHKSRFNVLAELTRLRRAACDPRLAAPELGRIGAKVQAFERLASELVQGRHQALVFSQFTDFLKLLAERLDANGLRYQYLDGSTPAAARGERVAAFQRGEGDLFLISLKAGGFGLNLTAADYVVIADPWWNPAAEDQAMGRAHRIGQQRPVTVYRLVTAGSIEERIVALHHDKRELAEGLLAGQDGGAPLAASELMDLLRE